MKFIFSKKCITYQHRLDDACKYWAITIWFPFIFNGIEPDFFDEGIEVFKLEAPTGFECRKLPYFKYIGVYFLGFGISYSSQWGY